MKPIDRVLGALSKCGCEPKPASTGRGWESVCPVHRDHKARLRFSTKDGRVVFRCTAGCTHGKICHAMRIAEEDLAPESNNDNTALPQVQKTESKQFSKAPNESQSKQSEPNIVRLADVVAQPLRWLWFERFPMGKLSLIFGDPSVNKSTLTMDMAARVSCGRPWPDRPNEANPAGGVVILNAEDDIADTVKPRLMATGADMNRIISIESVKRPGRVGASHFSLAADLLALKTAIQTVDARLVVIDPLTAYLDKTDSHSTAEVRGLLAPLRDLASKTGAAILAITHMNKSEGGRAMYRATGSLGFIAAARAGWLVVADENNPDRRMMLYSKGNLSKQRNGLAFTIQSVEVPGLGEHPTVQWEDGPIAMVADDALAMQQPDEDRNACDEAVVWLRAVLLDGPMPAEEVMQQAKINGITIPTLRRARTKAGIDVKRIGYGAAGKWYWELAIAPKMLTEPIDAHPKTVSPFGANEHL